MSTVARIASRYLSKIAVSEDPWYAWKSNPALIYRDDTLDKDKAIPRFDAFIGPGKFEAAQHWLGEAVKVMDKTLMLPVGYSIVPKSWKSFPNGRGVGVGYTLEAEIHFTSHHGTARWRGMNLIVVSYFKDEQEYPVRVSRMTPPSYKLAVYLPPSISPYAVKEAKFDSLPSPAEVANLLRGYGVAKMVKAITTGEDEE